MWRLTEFCNSKDETKQTVNERERKTDRNTELYTVKVTKTVLFVSLNVQSSPTRRRQQRRDSLNSCLLHPRSESVDKWREDLPPPFYIVGHDTGERPVAGHHFGATSFVSWCMHYANEGNYYLNYLNYLILWLSASLTNNLSANRCSGYDKRLTGYFSIWFSVK